jgi:hypothetical protein
MKKKLLIVFALVMILSSCNSKEDVVKDINKDGSVETLITVNHCNGFDVLNTTHKIWVQNSLLKTVIQSDTIPSLGTINEQVEDGSVYDEETKEYEVYITVK